MTYFLLILTGIVVGVFAPVFGVGGGILIVPTLHTFFDTLPAQSVIGCSLFVICINSTVNTWNFKRSKVEIKYNVALALAVSMAVGVILGGSIGLVLDPKTIKLFFASMALLLALKIILFKAQQNLGLPDILDRNFWIKTVLTGFFAGIISGLTGLGGGAVLVPLMISVLGLPVKFISPYSQFSMAVATFFGSLTYLLADTPKLTGSLSAIAPFQIGQVNIAISLAIVFGASFTSSYGVQLSKKLSTNITKKLFAGLLMVISVRIFISQLL